MILLSNAPRLSAAWKGERSVLSESAIERRHDRIPFDLGRQD